MLRRVLAFLGSLACATGAVFFAASGVTAQSPAPATLDPGVIATVERVYPGFTEILETCDPPLLSRLARTLVANPASESVEVLAWMLQFCPAWADGASETASQLSTLAGAAPTFPLARVSAVLLTGNPEQRVTAAIGLSARLNVMSSNQRQEIEGTLIAALSDKNVSVREFVASMLRRLSTPAGNAALARAIESPDVTEAFYSQATGRRRPAPRVDDSTFPPETVAAVNAIAPNFISTLNSDDDWPITQLRQTLDRSDDPRATAVLVWLLANGRQHEVYLSQALATPQRVSRLHLGELGGLLATANPDGRAGVAALLNRVTGALETFPPAQRLPSSSLEELIRALMPLRTDPRLDVRVNVLTILAAAIKQRGAPADQDIVRQLGELLGERDLTSSDRIRVLQAVGAIGDRTTLPLLERLTRSTDMRPSVREAATRAYVALSAPADPANERRRLEGAPPQNALENRVLAEGRAGLPLVWQTLATGPDSERRTAAALLGWYRDVGSIRPILAELDKSPGAVLRDQLLFDLNMILLTEGSRADAEQTNALAAAHLRWVYAELAAQTDNDNVGPDTVLSASTITVFPDPGIPDSVPLSGETRKVRSPRGLQLPTRVAAAAVRSESPQAFIQGVAKSQYGIAFHIIKTAEGVARVATTIYAPARGASASTWISLYRRNGDQWVPIPVPPANVRTPSGPSLVPAVQRDYGTDDPQKVMALDLAMERIRVDVNARSWLGYENGDWFSRSPRPRGPGYIPLGLDSTYIPLLERYKRSDVPSVRYTAEFESARLTGQPDMQLWLNALMERPPFDLMAQVLIGPYATSQIEKEGRVLQGRDRDALVAAAINPEAAAPALLPRDQPRRENVQKVQASTRFALVEMRFGTGDGGHGYSMLFERRGNRWIYLFAVKGWLA